MRTAPPPPSPYTHIYRALHLVTLAESVFVPLSLLSQLLSCSLDVGVLVLGLDSAGLLGLSFETRGRLIPFGSLMLHIWGTKDMFSCSKIGFCRREGTNQQLI